MMCLFLMMFLQFFVACLSPRRGSDNQRSQIGGNRSFYRPRLLDIYPLRARYDRFEPRSEQVAEIISADHHEHRTTQFRPDRRRNTFTTLTAAGFAPRTQNAQHQLMDFNPRTRSTQEADAANVGGNQGGHPGGTRGAGAAAPINIGGARHYSRRLSWGGSSSATQTPQIPNMQDMPTAGPPGRRVGTARTPLGTNTPQTTTPTEEPRTGVAPGTEDVLLQARRGHRAPGGANHRANQLLVRSTRDMHAGAPAQHHGGMPADVNYPLTQTGPAPQNPLGRNLSVPRLFLAVAPAVPGGRRHEAPPAAGGAADRLTGQQLAEHQEYHQRRLGEGPIAFQSRLAPPRTLYAVEEGNEYESPGLMSSSSSSRARLLPLSGRGSSSSSDQQSPAELNEDVPRRGGHPLGVLLVEEHLPTLSARRGSLGATDHSLRNEGTMGADAAGGTSRTWRGRKKGRDQFTRNRTLTFLLKEGVKNLDLNLYRYLYNDVFEMAALCGPTSSSTSRAVGGSVRLTFAEFDLRFGKENEDRTEFRTSFQNDWNEKNVLAWTTLDRRLQRHCENHRIPVPGCFSDKIEFAEPMEITGLMEIAVLSDVKISVDELILNGGVPTRDGHVMEGIDEGAEEELSGEDKTSGSPTPSPSASPSGSGELAEDGLVGRAWSHGIGLIVIKKSHRFPQNFRKKRDHMYHQHNVLQAGSCVVSHTNM